MNKRSVNYKLFARHCIWLVLTEIENAWRHSYCPQGVYNRKSESEVARSCPTLWDPMDCNPPGSSIHGIFQARVLEWGAIAFSRGSSQPRDRSRVSRITGRHFTVWATREVCTKGGNKNLWHIVYTCHIFIHSSTDAHLGCSAAYQP